MGIGWQTGLTELKIIKLRKLVIQYTIAELVLHKE